ncbi:MAG: hypothetical protein SFY70_06845 [Bacteroidia bacterium]|nr:hypothetical protein [Bacteroidia bacterium]
MPTNPPNDRPPVLGTWRRVYLVVIGALVLEVLLLWAFTLAYRS